MPLTENAIKILQDRYLGEGEVPDDLFVRVATAVARAEKIPQDVEHWEKIFFDMMRELRFLPNSPTLVNAGKEGKGCLSACFVMSPEDTMESIMQVCTDAAMTVKWGGGIGFGFSKLRHAGESIATVHGIACGPVKVMKLYAKVGETLTQGAFRLGAFMGQLRVDHPDIREFIHCKDDDDTLSNFNISVQVTDEFMRAVERGDRCHFYDPQTGGRIRGREEIMAKDLWNEICESAWKTGDPGVVFIDRVWRTAPNPDMDKIETSNPCGEEFLENYGSCNLGSINLLAHFVNGEFDLNLLAETVRHAVRFLDNVIEVNKFPIEKQKEVNLATRRIGLGIMGWADYLVKKKIPYDSPDALSQAESIGKMIHDTAENESKKLSKERGHRAHSSWITIAPTGTISRIAGCSSGIEPHFALAYKSNVLWRDQNTAGMSLFDSPQSIQEAMVEAYGDEASNLLVGIANGEGTIGIPDYLKTAHDIDSVAHLKMQAIWQKYVTNSVSKTINMPENATVEDVRNALSMAWKYVDIKSVTIYRDGSKSMQVLETGRPGEKDVRESLEKARSYHDGWTEGQIGTKKRRPRSIKGQIEKIRTGHGSVYVTVGKDPHDETPFEMFANGGKNGTCDSATIEAITRLASLGLRSGLSAERIIGTLRGIVCCPHWDEGTLVKSVPDALAIGLERSMDGSEKEQYPPYGEEPNVPYERPEPLPHPREEEIRRVVVRNEMTPLPHRLIPQGRNQFIRQLTSDLGLCPHCSNPMVHQEGCLVCQSCGWSNCGG